MKVLHVLDHSLPFHSGYAFRTQNIFRAERRRGWNPIGLTAPEHNQICNSSELVEVVEKFQYYRTPVRMRDGVPSLTHADHVNDLARRIEELAKVEKPDLLHVHSPALNGVAALRAARTMALSVVYEIRAFWEDAAVDSGRYSENSRNYKMSHAMEMWVCSKADRVVTICNGLKETLIDQGISAGKLTVVFNGVDPQSFPDVPNCRDYHGSWRLEGREVIGFIGSFFRYEGLDLLIEAVARLRASRPDIALLVIGGGQMESRLREQVERWGLNGTVIMPGRIPNDQIAGVYAVMDVLVYPRYSIRLTELVTPLKPLEAMASGKAVVASDVGGHRELIQDGRTGMLFSAGDVTALTQALTRMLDSPNLRTRYGAEARRWVREHRSWERTTANYAQVYAQALAS